MYLGVLLHQSLSWSNHITRTTAKASQLFNLLRCNLSNCSPSVKATAYLTIVRPVLEYAASVWDPYQQNDILSLEKVQCRAAQWTLSDYNRLSSVTDMLEILDWPSLESSRRIGQLQTFYKGINNLSGYPFCHISCQLNVPPDTTTLTTLSNPVHGPVMTNILFFQEQSKIGTACQYLS